MIRAFFNPVVHTAYGAYLVDSGTERPKHPVRNPARGIENIGVALCGEDSWSLSYYGFDSVVIISDSPRFRAAISAIRT